MAETTMMYRAAGKENFKLVGLGTWQFGPAGFTYKVQEAKPEEIEIAKAHGWRETLVDAIEAYLNPPEAEPVEVVIKPDPESEPVVTIEPEGEPEAEPVKRGPGRPRKIFA